MSPKGTPTIQPAKGVEYETPRDLFDQLWREFGGFDLDPCCRLEHYTAKRVLNNGGMIYVPPDTHSKPYRMLVDGLAHPWNADAVFCNPPYGPALRQWIPKAVAEVEIGNARVVVALVPAKTEVRWWQQYVIKEALPRRGASLPIPLSIKGEAPDPPRIPGWIVGHPLVDEVRFLPGRLKFGGGDGPARVGNVLVVWRK